MIPRNSALMSFVTKLEAILLSLAVLAYKNQGPKYKPIINQACTLLFIVRLESTLDALLVTTCFVFFFIFTAKQEKRKE